ncbi:MAG: hypothetical protein IKA01_03110 [Alistipes sp.]|nr:hypothetical protein [Alistipes sp.]
MRVYKYLFTLLSVVVVVACTDDKSDSAMSVESSTIEIDAVGGVKSLKVDIADSWIASTDNAWITVSPANGSGAVTCEFKIDSALTAEPRYGVVRIQNLRTMQSQEIAVAQAGFPYTIELEDNAFDVECYKTSEERYFDVAVRSNVEFDINILSDIDWLKADDYTLTLNRGLRPRQTTVRFSWDINTMAQERLAEITFTPKQAVELSRSDVLNVKQEAAEPIVPDTRSGDSIALLAVARNLDVMTQWDASQPMTMWNNVVLWDESMEGCTPENVGRVRSAQFVLFNTNEKMPFEVRYLTAAEELYFFGNTNTFMKSLELGDDICELVQLKRLTIGSYGLIDLPDSFKKLKNLEYLNICANNFQRVPSVLKKSNFPALRSLVMNANQRSVVYDLSNTTKTNLAGFIDEPKFPVDLIKWDLDTLVLSVNYLQGELPDFEDDASVPVYTQQDIERADTLPQFLVDNRIKKVMPSTKRFAINFNRLSGKLPAWLLYHPALDWWVPYSLVFSQEGRAQDGTQAGFENEPANLRYYYDIYTKKEPWAIATPEEE